MQSAPPASDKRLTFDRFCLMPTQRLLLRDGIPVRLGARAFDILVALAARPGELISKEELVAQVWPDTFVDAINLRVNMTALRKALGDGDGQLIRNDPGRGYRLVAPVAVAEAEAAPLGEDIPAMPAPSQPQAAAASLPRVVTRIIGRDDFIAGLAAQLPHRRIVTIVGSGGIGKTRVAIAYAEGFAGAYRDGVCFLDLTRATDAESVVGLLAEGLGVQTGPHASLNDVIDRIEEREMLLVVDNCEHVIDAAASLVESVSAGAPQVRILATSREALRIAGEWVRVLPPLASPPEGADLSAADALAYPAVELFVERAAAARYGYELRDADAPAVGEICRRLDGVALAIELAATQVDVLGLTWLSGHLHEQLRLLNRGRRTAVPRHQTLTAMLDWSYRLLTDQERMTLHRVAAFPGEFTLADAITMAADDGIRDVQVVDAVGGLVSKSLAMLDASGSVMRYRLPETTRAYACAKLRTKEPALAN